MNKRDLRAKQEHDEWLRKNNVHPEQLKSRLTKRSADRRLTAGDRDLQVQNVTSFPSGFAPIPGKRSVFDSQWKKTYDDEEMQRRERIALKKAEALKSRIMPLYNKGPLQLASESEDMTKVGALSRR